MYFRKILNSIPKNTLCVCATANQSSIIKKLLKCNHNNIVLLNSLRSISTTGRRWNYQGDGKTVATDIEDDIGRYIVVRSFNEQGFKLSNEAFAFGSLILFPNVYLSWKVKSIEDITEESLAVFKVIEPKLDLVVIGIGGVGQYSVLQIRDLKKKISNTGLNVEILPTENAIAIYNFMLQDFRVVAGGFLPPARKIEKTYQELESGSNNPKRVE